jgi:hypothetical protein
MIQRCRLVQPGMRTYIGVNRLNPAVPAFSATTEVKLNP